MLFVSFNSVPRPITLCRTDWLNAVNDLERKWEGPLVVHFKIMQLYFSQADVSGRAVWGVHMRPLACWDCRFESHWRHGSLSLVSVLCCQVEVSASGRSLVEIIPTECGVSERDREAWTRPWSTPSCRTMDEKYIFLSRDRSQQNHTPGQKIFKLRFETGTLQRRKTNSKLYTTTAGYAKARSVRTPDGDLPCSVL